MKLLARPLSVAALLAAGIATPALAQTEGEPEVVSDAAADVVSDASSSDTSSAPADVSSAEAAADVSSADATAAPRGTQHYLGGMGTYTFADSKRDYRLRELTIDSDLEMGTGGAVYYGWQFANRWGIEVQAFTETFETDVGGLTDFYRHGVTTDLVYNFGDRTGFTPFVLIGAGGAYNDVSPNEDKFDFIANAGLGFVTGPFTNYGDLRLRAEARYVYDNFEDGYEDIRVAVGIEIPLFGESAAAVASAVEPQAKVVEVPTGLMDTDGDGVVDERDQCPDTPANTRVDGNGCTLGKVIALYGVTFEFDKTRLRPDAETILDQAVDTLKRYPEMQVEVAGHTDSKGSDTYNQQLSEGRATAVRDYFVEKGVTNPLTVHGYGEAEPVTTNDTDEGRERNRRVELRIQN